jgi:hypothetical protein
MKIIKNEKLIKRNGKIGQWTSLGGILIVVIPMFFYIQSLRNGDLEELNVTLLLVVTFVGIIASQVGLHYGSRFGRSPRPDEKLDAGLKGLQNEFTIYHYTAPVSHLLVGPAGVWVLLPYHQSGQVVYSKKRWRISGGGFMQGYLRIFGQEGLGRPDIDAESQAETLKKHFTKTIEESEIPAINTMLVFTSDAVQLDPQDSPILAMKLKEVKEFVRKKVKEKPISPAQLAAVRAALPE